MQLYNVTVYVVTGMSKADLEANATASGFSNVEEITKAPEKAEAVSEIDQPTANFLFGKSVEAENQEAAWDKVRPAAVNVGHCLVTAFRVSEVVPKEPS